MAEEKKQEKKPKKKDNKVSINLPKARQSIKRSHEIKQMKENTQGLYEALGVIMITLLILFILLGGINQRKLFTAFAKLGTTIGNKVYHSTIENVELEVNEDGVYLVPATESNSPQTDTKNTENKNTTDESNIENKNISDNDDSTKKK